MLGNFRLCTIAAFHLSAVAVQAQNARSCSDLTDNSAKIEYRLRAPSEATARRMLDQLDYQRPIQMYLWSRSAVRHRGHSGLL
jgi:hypothetical protein